MKRATSKSPSFYWLMVLVGGLLGVALAAGTTSAGTSATRQQVPVITPSPTRTATPTNTPACGLAWRGVPSPNQPGDNTLRAVDALSANDVWAVGHQGTHPNYNTLVLHWNGSQWSVVPSPNVPGGSNVLRGVAALSPNDVWAVGYRGTYPNYSTLVLHWDGSQWSVVPSPNAGAGENTLMSVSAVSPSDVWAVGYHGTYPNYSTLALHWDGTQWSITPTPNPGAYANGFGGVEAISANDVWAVGSFSDSYIGGQSLTAHWDGTQWSVVQSPNYNGVNGLYAVSGTASNDVWAVGQGPYLKLIMHWDGAQWRLVDPPPGGDTRTLAVEAISPNDVWATSYGSGPIGGQLLHWNGTNWVYVHNINGPYLYGISAISSTDIWAVGDAGPAGQRTFTERYNDPCSTPTNTPTVTLTVTGTPPTATSTSTRPPSYTPTITRTATNTQPPSSTPSFTPTPTSPTTPNPSNTPTIAPTPSPTPCGQGWSIVSSPNGPNDNRLTDVEVIAHDDVWAVGYYNEGGGARTLTLHWNGTSWSVIPSPNPAAFSNLLTGVAAVAPDDVWAVGSIRSSTTSQVQTLAMHWNGSTWSVVPTPNTGFATSLSKVSAVSASDVWALGEYALGPDSGRPLSMRWNGSQWSIISMPHAGCGMWCVMNDLSARAGDDVWAVGTAFDGQQFQTHIQHWNGAAWSIVPSPNPGPFTNSLYGVSTVGPNDVWAVGYYAPQSGGPAATLTLRWNGTQWAHVPSPNVGSSSNDLRTVDALTANEVWAVGTYLNAGVEQALSLRWDGSQWSHVAMPAAGAGLNRVQGVSVRAPDQVWAVGYYAASNLQTLTLRYGDTCPTPTVTVTPLATATATPTLTPIPTTTATTPPHTNTPVPTTTTAPSATATACPVRFTDVPSDNPFYEQVRCLACRGIVSGYDNGTFQPGNDVTRGQLAKIVSNAAGFSENPNPQIFEDVPPTNPFYEWINRLARRGHMGGYECGSPGEPCISGRSYFRPFANATRGQTSKIVANAANITDPVSGQTFEDVPSNHAFYEWIEKLAGRGVMGGYECGGPGEPCVSGRAYFRPYNNVTRGQSAKIVANTFYPNCQAP